MLVILVVGIAGIWIGACIWRRRYLRKKERQTTLGQKFSGSASHPSWGPNGAGSGSVAPAYTDENRGQGVFMPGAQQNASVFEEEKPRRTKKKWAVSERT